MNTLTRTNKIIMDDKVEDDFGFILWNAIREVSMAKKKAPTEPLAEKLDEILNGLYDVDWVYEHDNDEDRPETGDCDD